MTHYLTQPEEIDYILMAEKQDTEAGMPLATPLKQNRRNISDIARSVQNNTSESCCHVSDL